MSTQRCHAEYTARWAMRATTAMVLVFMSTAHLAFSAHAAKVLMRQRLRKNCSACLAARRSPAMVDVFSRHCRSAMPMVRLNRKAPHRTILSRASLASVTASPHWLNPRAIAPLMKYLRAFCSFSSSACFSSIMSLHLAHAALSARCMKNPKACAMALRPSSANTTNSRQRSQPRRSAPPTNSRIAPARIVRSSLCSSTASRHRSMAPAARRRRRRPSALSATSIMRCCSSMWSCHARHAVISARLNMKLAAAFSARRAPCSSPVASCHLRNALRTSALLRCRTASFSMPRT
mmetsp:Transcript_16553/g.40515  ORF Transcript_16553/g.40515 Transcript_16553/m.40515 type:complete len:292 (-) Transcript_16553:1022-1897(-)